MKTKIVGLTGGIGSGKSTIAQFFKELGVPVYVADQRARTIMEEAQTIEQVQQIFKENVILDNGQLDRKKIAHIVFNQPELLQKLNQIIHPKVKADFAAWLHTNCHHKYVIKEVAILFEMQSQNEFDKIILVTAPEDLRIKRVMQRDQISEQEVKDRIKNQLPDSKKMDKSDFIINNTNKYLSEIEVKRIHELLIL